MSNDLCLYCLHRLPRKKQEDLLLKIKSEIPLLIASLRLILQQYYSQRLSRMLRNCSILVFPKIHAHTQKNTLLTFNFDSGEETFSAECSWPGCCCCYKCDGNKRFMMSCQSNMCHIVKSRTADGFQ